MHFTVAAFVVRSYFTYGDRFRAKCTHESYRELFGGSCLADLAGLLLGLTNCTPHCSCIYETASYNAVAEARNTPEEPHPFLVSVLHDAACKTLLLICKSVIVFT